MQLVAKLQADVVAKAEAAAMWQTRAELLASQVEQLQRALPDPSQISPGVDSAASPDGAAEQRVRKAATCAVMAAMARSDCRTG